MKLWISGELEGDVADTFRESRAFLESRLNDAFSHRDYGQGLDKWALIAMVRGENSPSDYREVKRYDRQRKTAEFRLIIDHDKFKAADVQGRAALLYEALRRSLLLLSEMSATDVDVHSIQSDLETIARQNGWAP